MSGIPDEVSAALALPSPAAAAHALAPKALGGALTPEERGRPGSPGRVESKQPVLWGRGQAAGSAPWQEHWRGTPREHGFPLLSGVLPMSPVCRKPDSQLLSGGEKPPRALCTREGSLLKPFFVYLGEIFTLLRPHKRHLLQRALQDGPSRPRHIWSDLQDRVSLGRGAAATAFWDLGEKRPTDIAWVAWDSPGGVLLAATLSPELSSLTHDGALQEGGGSSAFLLPVRQAHILICAA